ncbi:peptide chain release factor N(5)-glutamine methyltransferase [Desulfosarcina variabilis]|uniref:peptide chain release factor N(5)-glutamine methyltransferase n=1 Tax=Desulfosarcina variabilis TaxID=2300 RepID=UPI003AFAE643
MPNASTPEQPIWTIIELVRWTTSYFRSHQLENPRIEAEILLAHVLGVRRIDLYLNHDQPLDKKERGYFKALIKRRLSGEPVAYITGRREFWSLELMVGPQVLIPRPETECLVEAVLPFLQNGDTGGCKRILDMGTGSGAIAIALAHEYPQGQFVAMDHSLAALKMARQNARKHGVDPHIVWYCGSWDAPLKPEQETFDLIVSNPPYIPSGDIDGLQTEVRDYEPRLALDGCPDGVSCLRTIIQSVYRYLKSGGMLALEMGWDQAAAVIEIANCTGQYENIQIIKDYSKLDRVATMRKLSSKSEMVG